ncbi:Ppx/GppA phosphatase family protein [soil metagenome]
MRRVAAVDCGTNSLKLLVTDLDAASGAQHDVLRTLRIVRLGQGVDRTGQLAPDAVDRTLQAAADYAEQITALGVGLDPAHVAIAATSATRDAANGSELVNGLQRHPGAQPRVLSGVDEAATSYAGAVRGLAEPAQARLLLIDIGGGSTELVRGQGPRVDAAGSADVGSVRLTERHLTDDPPTPDQVAAATVDVDTALDGVGVPVDDVDLVVVVGGTGLTVAAHTLGLGAPGDDGLHGSCLDAVRVRASCAALLAATVAERRAMDFMHPGRADVIGGGALVLDRILDRLGSVEVLASTHDVLDGLAWSLLDPPTRPEKAQTA